MLTSETVFPPGDFRAGYFDDTVPRATYIAKVEALKAYVPEHASSLAALALKFALWRPGVTTGITSMHELRYARMNIAAAAEPRLPESVFKALMFKHRFIKSFMDVRNFADLDVFPIRRSLSIERSSWRARAGRVAHQTLLRRREPIGRRKGR